MILNSTLQNFTHYQTEAQNLTHFFFELNIFFHSINCNCFETYICIAYFPNRLFFQSWMLRHDA